MSYLHVIDPFSTDIPCSRCDFYKKQESSEVCRWCYRTIKRKRDLCSEYKFLTQTLECPGCGIDISEEGTFFCCEACGLPSCNNCKNVKCCSSSQRDSCKPFCCHCKEFCCECNVPSCDDCCSHIKNKIMLGLCFQSKFPSRCVSNVCYYIQRYIESLNEEVMFLIGKPSDYAIIKEISSDLGIPYLISKRINNEDRNFARNFQNNWLARNSNHLLLFYTESQGYGITDTFRRYKEINPNWRQAVNFYLVK